MPVRYTPPSPAALLPVAGVALGTAAAKIKNWARDDVLVALFDAGTVAAGVFTQNRFCAAPVTVCRRHLARDGTGGASLRALVVNTGNANAGTGARGLADAETTCAAVASLARLHDAGSAAVLDRRDHGAAAGRPARRRAAGGEGRRPAGQLVRRRVGDHDDRHRAQGRVAARRRRRRRASPSPASPRARE